MLGSAAIASPGARLARAAKRATATPTKDLRLATNPAWSPRPVGRSIGRDPGYACRCWCGFEPTLRIFGLSPNAAFTIVNTLRFVADRVNFRAHVALMPPIGNLPDPFGRSPALVAPSPSGAGWHGRRAVRATLRPRFVTEFRAGGNAPALRSRVPAPPGDRCLHIAAAWRRQTRSRSHLLMTKRMLIDAAHPEETRVVVINDGQLEEFEFESSTKKQLKGNIYLAKVTRVEPSLQAAFVDYGGQRHGFLAFSEIHPDYYQIPRRTGACSTRPSARSQRSRRATATRRKPRRGIGGGRHRPRGGGRRGLRRAGQAPLAAAAQLQDPGGDQAAPDPAGPGGQGGAGQQRGGADHLPVPCRPLQRSHAEQRGGGISRKIANPLIARASRRSRASWRYRRAWA